MTGEIRGKVIQTVDESNFNNYAVTDHALADWIEDGGRVAVVTAGSSHPVIEHMHRGRVTRVIPFTGPLIHRLTNLQNYHVCGGRRRSRGHDDGREPTTGDGRTSA